jgi:hypothetical protein
VAITRADWFSFIRSRNSARLIRWPSTMKWPRLFRNSKYKISEIKSTYSTVCCLLIHFIVYSYRGYYSRKYEHDFYARKTYLNHVQTKNEEVRKKLSEYQRQLGMEE